MFQSCIAIFTLLDGRLGNVGTDNVMNISSFPFQQVTTFSTSQVKYIQSAMRAVFSPDTI